MLRIHRIPSKKQAGTNVPACDVVCLFLNREFLDKTELVLLDKEGVRVGQSLLAVNISVCFTGSSNAELAHSTRALW